MKPQVPPSLRYVYLKVEQRLTEEGYYLEEIEPLPNDYYRFSFRHQAHKHVVSALCADLDASTMREVERSLEHVVEKLTRGVSPPPMPLTRAEKLLKAAKGLGCKAGSFAGRTLLTARNIISGALLAAIAFSWIVGIVIGCYSVAGWFGLELPDVPPSHWWWAPLALVYVSAVSEAMRTLINKYDIL